MDFNITFKMYAFRFESDKLWLTKGYRKTDDVELAHKEESFEEMVEFVKNCKRNKLKDDLGRVVPLTLEIKK